MEVLFTKHIYSLTIFVMENSSALCSSVLFFIFIVCMLQVHLTKTYVDEVQRHYPFPPYLFRVGMGVSLIRPLEGDVECHTTGTNKHGDRRGCYLIVIDLFIWHGAGYKQCRIDSYSFVPSHRTLFKPFGKESCIDFFFYTGP